jgi:hypothetical protein
LDSIDDDTASEITDTGGSNSSDEPIVRNERGFDQQSLPERDNAAPEEEGNPVGSNDILHDKRLGDYSYQDSNTPPSKDITAGPKHPKRVSNPLSSALLSIMSNNSNPTFLVTFDDSNKPLFAIDNDHDSAFLATQAKNNFLDAKTPKTLKEAQSLPEAIEWKKATDAESTQLLNFGTWTLVPLPEGRKAIKSRWVFRIKRNSNEELEKFKSRLVACGYSQKAGVDYSETFSPVA